MIRRLDICANSAIKLVSAIMLHEAVAFKTISDRYTNNRMVPFLTHIDEFRANLFSRNSRQIDTHYGKSTVFFFFFFHRKIGCNKLFLSNTAEVRSIYLKMGHIMRKPVLSYVNNKGADQPARTSYTDSVSKCRFFVINPFDIKLTIL